MVKRGESGLSGVLLVDKPAGITSHDVVSRCRRVFSEKRIGHAGTLDPDATGLLVVCVGPATRLVQYLTTDSKTYEARIVFGTETTTDDASGQIRRSATVPDEVCDIFFATSFMASLVGEHEQIPPAFSAIKQNGQVAYKAARKGEEVVIPPRTITITEASLKGILSLDTGEVVWDISVQVSKGTYIRSLARDIGCALGSAAHLGGLRRTRSGSLEVADAVSLDDLSAAQNPVDCFVDVSRALQMPVARIDEEYELALYQGKLLPLHLLPKEPVADDQLVALMRGDRLLSIHRRCPQGLKAETVIPGGVLCPPMK